jgi:uncharacterized iron-regulated protein
MKAALVALVLAANPALAGVMPAADADVVILGEIHDNPAHHAEQARLVGQLRPEAVVWEMLTPGQLAQAAGADRADEAAFGAALGWEAAGWPDFAMYHPIFLASADALHLGGAVPRGELRPVMEKGALAAWGAPVPWFDAARVLGPLDPEDLDRRKAEQAEAHCNALPVDLLPGMVEAQRFRDATMASAALGALADGKRPVVIITGSGHARTDVGIPAMIRAARPDVTVWALGQVEADPGPDAPYDAVNVTAPAPRQDPCAAFR